MKYLSLLLLLLSFALPVNAADQEADTPPQTVSKESRCPVCGMYAARYPKWRTQVIFSDKGMVTPDSPAELFRFLNNMGRYDKRHTVADIRRIYVTDYESGEWVDAKQAFFVSGSNAMGPMRMPDLPAFADRARAERFSSKNGGKALAYDQITPEVVSGLQGHDHHSHSH